MKKKIILLSIILITVFLIIAIILSTVKIKKEGLLLDVLGINIHTIEKIKLSYHKNSKLMETDDEIKHLITIINKKVIFQEKYKEEKDGEEWIIRIEMDNQDSIRLSLNKTYIRWRIKNVTYLYQFDKELNIDLLNEIINKE